MVLQQGVLQQGVLGREWAPCTLGWPASVLWAPCSSVSCSSVSCSRVPACLLRALQQRVSSLGSAAEVRWMTQHSMTQLMAILHCGSARPARVLPSCPAHGAAMMARGTAAAPLGSPPAAVRLVALRGSGVPEAKERLRLRSVVWHRDFMLEMASENIGGAGRWCWRHSLKHVCDTCFVMPDSCFVGCSLAGSCFRRLAQDGANHLTTGHKGLEQAI